MFSVESNPRYVPDQDHIYGVSQYLCYEPLCDSDDCVVFEYFVIARSDAGARRRARHMAYVCCLLADD